MKAEYEMITSMEKMTEKSQFQLLLSTAQSYRYSKVKKKICGPCNLDFVYCQVNIYTFRSKLLQF